MRRRLFSVLASALLVTVAISGAVPVRSQGADIPRQISVGTAPLLADLAAPQGPIRLRPVDPATLADIPDLAPIEVGHHYNQAVSPDGRTLAVISWPSGSHNAGGSLVLIDLATWTSHPTGVTINDQVLGPVYSADGSALWWAAPGWRDREHGIARGYSLVRYDMALSHLEKVVTFAESFEPWQIRPLRDAQHVAVFGVPIDTGNLAEGSPRLEVVDSMSGSLAAVVPLDGVKAGQFRVTDGVSYPYHEYRPGLAWDIARDRLYVVYPDEDRLSVVDLVAGRVTASEPIRPRTSALDSLLAALAPSAEAKSVPTTQRWTVLSPDGSRLYVSGAPEGLFIIDTQDLADIGRVELPGTAFALAPGGRPLLVDEPFYPRGFSPDGRYAYVARMDPGPMTVLRVVDVRDGHVVAERVVDGYVAALLLIPSGGPDW
jgi:hypothetical protein